MPAPLSRLLVPLDLSEVSERAIAAASSLASRTGGVVRLYHAAADAIGAREAEEGLRRLAVEETSSTSITVEVEAEVQGDRSTQAAIAEAAARRGATICMAAQGRSGIARAALGSVAHATLRLVDQPVVLVGPCVTRSSNGDASSLVTCVDGSPEAELIVPEAATWAETLRLSLTLVQVVEPASPPPDAGIPEAFMDGSYLADLCDEVQGTPTSFEVLHGDPVNAIVRYAATSPGTAALLAVAPRVRTGLARIALGSTSMHLVHRASCPVLVLHPPVTARRS